jgi:hypothetical protein
MRHISFCAKVEHEGSTLKKIIAATAIASILALSASAAETFLGLPVHKQAFPVAGGKSIALPMTVHGPVPATAEGVTVEIAGPVAVAATTPNKIHVAWGFSISVPMNAAYRRVLITNISTDPPTVLVSQDQPPTSVVKIPDGSQLKVLQLRGAGADVGPEATPWIYQDGVTAFVFRVVLIDASGKLLTLHQPALFGEDVKLKLRQMAAQTPG